MIKRITYFIIIGIILLGAGIAIGYFVPRILSSSSSSSSSSSYTFINPAVTSNLNKHFIINFQPLREKMIAIREKYPQKTYIYFNYLNNGSWIGLDERENFAAASLVKVPLAIAVYKAIEEGKLSSDQTYVLEELDLDNNFGELYKVGSDKQFTVEELVKIMLEQSDNTARMALFNIFEKIGIQDPLYNVYTSLGWDIVAGIFPGSDQTEFIDPNLYNEINLKLLSNMFVALYNSTFLDIEYSQRILGNLANTPFKDKIAAGVPEDIPVVHKIGVSAGSGTFSDCGIVYAPNRNYLLCLGSNAKDEKSAAKFMAEVSKAVYQFVINN